MVDGAAAQGVVKFCQLVLHCVILVVVAAGPVPVIDLSLERFGPRLLGVSARVQEQVRIARAETACIQQILLFKINKSYFRWVLNYLIAGFETCFRLQHPRCRDPVSKHISVCQYA